MHWIALKNGEFLHRLMREYFFPNRYNYHKHGGHFAHIDNTDGVVGDLTSFIQKIK